VSGETCLANLCAWKQVPDRPVHVGHGGVPQGMQGIQAIESRFHLQCPKGDLDSALADADAGLRAEKKIAGLQSFRPSRFVGPEFPEFND